MTDAPNPLPRFDGASAWAALTPEVQAAIGAIALEFIVNLIGEDKYFSGLEMKPEGRPFIAATPLIIDHLREAGTIALYTAAPEALSDRVPIPSLLGPVCRVCLCSEDDACENGCSWAEPDLCSACAGLATRTPDADAAAAAASAPPGTACASADIPPASGGSS